jgi:predicted permease
MDTLLQDLRFAVRTLSKAPLFTMVAVVSLSIGIGANTAVYALIHALFLRSPAGVARADELVAFHQVEPHQGGEGWWEFSSYPDYVHYRDHSTVFSGLSSHFGFTAIDSAAAEEIPGTVVSANYFSVLGVEPHLGRFFESEEDEVPDRNFVVVLSHRFWHRRFGGDPRCLGQSFKLNGVPLTIVGIAPPAFQGAVVGGSDDVWIPNMIARVAFRQMNILSRGTSGDQSPLRLVGRLRPGRTISNARAELTVLVHQLYAAHTDLHPWSEVSVYPLKGVHPQWRPEHAKLAFVLSATTTGLLMIACLNLAGLLLARGLARSKEFATRFALGARRSRVVRQLLTESLVLALLGGVAGLLVASWCAALLESHYTLRLRLSLDPPALVFNAFLILTTGIAFGLVPAWRASRSGLVPLIHESWSAFASRRSVLRSAFVVLQIAVSLVLLVGAGLLVQSRETLIRRPGFDPRNVLYLQMKPHLSGYDAIREKAYFREVERRLKSLPGVHSVALAFRPPLRGQELPDVSVSLPGENTPSPQDVLRVKQNVVTPAFFEALAIPLVRGPGFQARDLESDRGVVVNDVLAGRLWPATEAIGRTLMIDGKPHEVVGIVRYDNFRRSGEAPRPFLFRAGLASNRMMVRVDRDPRQMLALVRREVRAVDPEVAITAEGPFADMLRDSFAPVTLAMSVLGNAGALALLLSALGLYGVLAVAVVQRTREIGIRMALGASARGVVALVLRDGGRLVFIGLTLGTSWAIASTRGLSNYLHGVTRNDPFTFGVVIAVLGTVCLLACYVPARRAAKLDPVQALRTE